MSPWKTIETMPWDDRDVLIGFYGHSRPPAVVPANRAFFDINIFDPQPTHWMEIPQIKDDLVVIAQDNHKEELLLLRTRA